MQITKKSQNPLVTEYSAQSDKYLTYLKIVKEQEDLQGRLVNPQAMLNLFGKFVPMISFLVFDKVGSKEFRFQHQIQSFHAGDIADFGLLLGDNFTDLDIQLFYKKLAVSFLEKDTPMIMRMSEFVEVFKHYTDNEFKDIEIGVPAVYRLEHTVY